MNTDAASPGRMDIWRIQRECLEYCNRVKICPRSATASSQDDVRAGIPGVAEETWHRSRCFITARVCRPAKAGLELFSHPTHRSRGGLNNSALAGLGLCSLKRPVLLAGALVLLS